MAEAKPAHAPSSGAPSRWKRILSSVRLIGILALIAGVSCYLLKGFDGVVRALQESGELMLMIAPLVIAGGFLAGYGQVLIPREVVARWLGTGSGLRGLLIATVAGAVTPGGPMACFPLVVVLVHSGADRGSVVAYTTAWGLLAWHRLFIWELPIMGPEFAVVRTLAVLPLPLVAGLIARMLTFKVELPDGARLP